MSNRTQQGETRPAASDGLALAAALDTIGPIAARHPGLELLLLHGSQARGDDHPLSDWDFAYLADPSFDPAALLADLVLGLETDRIDLVNLQGASGLLRYRAARDGFVLHQTTPETFERFWKAAVTFWCDAEPILRHGYDAILAELDP